MTSPTNTPEPSDIAGLVAKVIVSWAFGECQPDRGDIFGWLDDRKDALAATIATALERLAQQPAAESGWREEAMREALEFYRDNWVPRAQILVSESGPRVERWKEPTATLQKDGGKRARQALAPRAEDEGAGA